MTAHKYDPIATIETFAQGTLALYTNPSGRNLHLDLDDDILIESQRGAELRVFAQSILDALDKQEGSTPWARPAGETRPVYALGDYPEHPDSGNFVFSTNGRLYFGGAIYYCHGYAPQSAVKPEPKPEPTPEPEFKVGDTVNVTHPVYARTWGKGGSPVTHVYPDHLVEINHPEHGRGAFKPSEIEHVEPAFERYVLATYDSAITNSGRGIGILDRTTGDIAGFLREDTAANREYIRSLIERQVAGTGRYVFGHRDNITRV